MLRVQNQLSIYPQVNLVTNIGLNSNAGTHTTSKKHLKDCVESKEIHFPLKHPLYVLSNRAIDHNTSRYKFFSYRRILRYYLKYKWI